MSRPFEGIQATYALFGERLAERELPKGYALAYPEGQVWSERLQAFCTTFEHGHPGFSLHVVPEQGRLWLHVEGPAGSREYLRDTLTLSSGVRHSWRWKTCHRFRRLTAPLRRLPDFLIIGAARSGTTALHRYLAEHPAVAEAERKEIGFFDRHWSHGANWYRAHFPLAISSAKQMTGEGTPEYLFDPRVPARVASLVPEVRLIALLREPLERAYSHYHLQVRNGLESLPFAEAVELEEQRMAGELERMNADPSYFSETRHAHSYCTRGLYAEQLEPWLAAFSRDQLLVLSTEAFERDSAGSFQRVLRFLGLDAWDPPEYRRHHRAPRAALDPELTQRFAPRFEASNERLYELLGEDLGWDQRVTG